MHKRTSAIKTEEVPCDGSNRAISEKEIQSDGTGFCDDCQNSMVPIKKTLEGGSTKWMLGCILAKGQF
jgi:hypothetical protein